MGVSTLRKRINNFSCQKCIEFLTQHAFVAGLTANLSLRAPHVKQSRSKMAHIKTNKLY